MTGIFTARRETILDSFLGFDRDCPSSEAVVNSDIECLVNPALMCNGIRNCEDCSDEDTALCLDTPCRDGTLASLLIIFLVLP